MNSLTILGSLHHYHVLSELSFLPQGCPHALPSYFSSPSIQLLRIIIRLDQHCNLDNLHILCCSCFILHSLYSDPSSSPCPFIPEVHLRGRIDKRSELAEGFSAFREKVRTSIFSDLRRGSTAAVHSAPTNRFIDLQVHNACEHVRCTVW